MTQDYKPDFRALCAELADALNELSPYLEAQSPVPVVTEAIKVWSKARSALAQPEPQGPVPVTERLPGPEDCAPWPDEPDANPWCWAGKEVDGGWEWAQIGLLGVDAKNLGWVLGGGGWTHWLPHHALPVPQQEADHD